MFRRRIKLIWGASQVIRGHWYFGLIGLYERIDGERDSGIAISVRGALVAMLAFGVIAYFAGALALATFWQRNPYSLLTYRDAVLYPVQRGTVADKKGQAFIAEGMDLWRASKWQDSARLLTLGLSLHPQDNRARLTLAQFHSLANQRAKAAEVLRAGLAAEFPGRSYLQEIFEIADAAEDFDLVVVTADRYLPLLNGPAFAADRNWLLARKFAALLESGQAVAALRLAEEEPSGAMATEHRVMALLTLNRAGEAVAFLEQNAAQRGMDALHVARLRVRALREAGRGEDLERAVAELRAMAPGDARIAVYVIVQCAMAGRDGAARKHFDDYLFRFGGEGANLTLLTEPLTEIGARTLLELSRKWAADHGFPVRPIEAQLVQVCVQRGEWADASTLLAQLKPLSAASVRSAEADKLWRDWMAAQVGVATTGREAARMALIEVMRDRVWPGKIYRKTIETLRKAGREELAAEVVALAQSRYPASAWLKGQGAELTRVLAARSAPVQPSVATLGPAPKASGAQAFFSELDTLLLARKWVQAEQHIRSFRNTVPPPAWLETRDADLRLAAVRIGQGRGEKPAMLAAAKMYANGDTERALRLLQVAREFRQDGDAPAALALVEVVLRTSPDLAAAQSLFAELKPKPVR